MNNDLINAAKGILTEADNNSMIADVTKELKIVRSRNHKYDITPYMRYLGKSSAGMHKWITTWAYVENDINAKGDIAIWRGVLLWDEKSKKVKQTQPLGSTTASALNRKSADTIEAAIALFADYVKNNADRSGLVSEKEAASQYRHYDGAKL